MFHPAIVLSPGGPLNRAGALRSEMPVRCKRSRPPGRPMNDACMADVFNTPVASRCRNYGVESTGAASAYDAIP